ncbi:gastrula zinc finger protein XlCGF48.2-like [Rhinoderma darwinii]|uniref:gastrula zinc finger protein XlCGF48.2-like n=1 Tax=Rhinoderma darwinii TaxID=43563 RepID=UPI003F66E831
MVANDDVTERILGFALEIIYLLTGEDYGPLKKSAEAVIHGTHPHLSGEQCRSQSSIVEPPPLIYERNDEQKILDLTNKIIELLTGEVPVRCQDVTVYFSMEEWEYIEEHKDLYKDIMMEEHQPLTSPGKRDLYKDVMMEDQQDRTSPVKFVLSGRSPHIKEEYVTKDGGLLTDNYIFTATNPSRDPSPHVQDEVSCSGGNLQHMDTCTPTDHTDYVSFQIKDEGVLRFEENLCGISTHRPRDKLYIAHHFEGEPISYQGGITDTDVCTSSDHTQQYSSIPIKIEPVAYDGDNVTDVYTSTDHPQQYPSYITSCQQGNLTGIYTPKTHTWYQSTYIKEEPISCDEGDLTDSDIMPLGHTPQDLSPIKHGEVLRDEENRIDTNVYTPTEHLKYTSGLTKEQRNNGLELWSKQHVYSCSECDKSFNCKSELLMHLPVHSGDKPYNCSICGKCFTNLSYLITHGKIHAGEKRYSCPDCGVSFTRSSNLKTHKRKHTGEKPYLCSDCGKSFSNKSNLNAHRKRHTGDKPYSCPDCGKRFISRSHLVVHQRTHTGEKPYTCPLCIKCFSNTSDLAKHRKIHNKKPYYCSKCGKCYKSNPDLDNQKLHICN